MRLADVFRPDPEKISFDLEPRKAIEAILYLANRLEEPGLHSITHLMYFADKMSLEKHGRFICGDDYYAMPYGPVPSFCYSLLKEATVTDVHGFRTVGRRVVPLRQPELDYLSDSDITCLEVAVQEHGGHPFPKVRDDSHDGAYEAAWKERGSRKSSRMSVESIAAQLRNPQELLGYLQSRHSK